MFRTLETFLVTAAENLSNKIFCLGLVRQEKLQISRPATKKKLAGPAGKAFRPGPHLTATAKGGLAA